MTKMGEREVYYKVTDGFVHRKVAGNDVLISVGKNVANFNGYISLNSTASFLWDSMSTPRTERQLIQALVEEFEVTEQTACMDLQEFLSLLKENSMIRESEYENS